MTPSISEIWILVSKKIGRVWDSNNKNFNITNYTINAIGNMAGDGMCVRVWVCVCVCIYMDLSKYTCNV